MYETRLKAVSFLKYNDTGYKQAPYEPITKEEYEAMMADITPIVKIDDADEGSGTKFVRFIRVDIVSFVYILV